ncbi:MAG: sulfotransferase [Gammaproteobacteria bacterium]|nr:sulfotransferase [Gammaproteobacteria bacterium]
MTDCAPVFFVGAPRSGTTIIFEVFGSHESVGWLSNYSNSFPSWPSLNLLCRIFDNRFFDLRGQKKQHGRLIPGNRFLPRPEEAYDFWSRYCDADFLRDYLLGVDASPETAAVIADLFARTSAYQGKPCMANKVTGPGRIQYLSSIFPQARFVHVIRNGRDVVRSLMKVGFWKEGGGFEHPWWNNGLPEDLLKAWEESDRDPEVLAAIQWVTIVRSIQSDASRLAEGRYFEFRYEEFIEDPHREIGKLFTALNLKYSRRAHGYIDATMSSGRSNRTRAPDGSRINAMLDEILSSLLNELGYSSPAENA